ncbi:photoreceptor cilium actin regulator [Labrus bergylta]|uniref:photoreceptor cilium actin regulator n=1 Tax=Labrus bergylta TaxID=56723 RepID=UPI00331433F5
MGCSPSKGKLFSKPSGPVPQNASPAEAEPTSIISTTSQQDVVDLKPDEDEEESKCLKTDETENEPPPCAEEQPVKETNDSPLASITSAAQNTENIREIEVGLYEKIDDGVVRTAKIKKMEKRKKNKGKKRSSERKKSFTVPVKVDFPPHMVRAHQAAYAFLNPNISKYETLLGLLDQAAQTQLSLQPMMSALVLRFEEINEALEEMAEEGELMLKEHGDFMALPSGMLGPAVMQTKPRNTMASPPEPPPDLLQQLLQHSTEKMRLVGGSVQALGDTTLEEAVEYFSSLSRLLFEKLQAKQTAEQRLTQVLARVEGAAMRKSILEDTALHSEDSGIGGENESLPGSERHRNHRGSAGSGSCGSGNNVRCAFDTQSVNLPNLEDDEEDEEEDDDEDEEYEDDEVDGPERKRSNSSPPDPCQALLYMREKYMQDWQPSVKRPQTAVTASKVERSSSARCVNIMMELQRSQRDLDQQISKMANFRAHKDVAGQQCKVYRAGLRRHSSSGSGSAQKGPLRTNQSSCVLPALAPQPPKRPSVRRLINTFSQGVDGRPGQSLANIPPHIRKPRKSRILLLSDTVNGNEGVSGINGNNNNNGWPDGRDELDELDSLPPPPPEVLMDDSFQSTEGLPGNGTRTLEDSVRSLPMISQNTGVSQRLKASLQNVNVLPNRASVRSTPNSVMAIHPVSEDAMRAQDVEQQPQTDLDPELEKANALYQQARKIIHLRNASENPDNRMSQKYDSNEFYEGEMTSPSLPVTAPPVSRVRLPPSCHSVCQRFPTPPVNRPQTASRSSSRPGSPRKVTRATDKNTQEIIPSVSFHDARSVFCLKESQDTCVTPGGSVLPRPMGEASRGRLTTRGMDNSTRRTQSEQRPGLASS